GADCPAAWRCWLGSQGFMRHIAINTVAAAGRAITINPWFSGGDAAIFSEVLLLKPPNLLQRPRSKDPEPDPAWRSEMRLRTYSRKHPRQGMPKYSKTALS